MAMLRFEGDAPTCCVDDEVREEEGCPCCHESDSCPCEFTNSGRCLEHEF